MATTFRTSGFCYRAARFTSPRIEIFVKSATHESRLSEQERIATARPSTLLSPRVKTPPLNPNNTHALLERVRCFLNNIDAVFSPGVLSSEHAAVSTKVPCEIVLTHVSPDQYKAIQCLVDTGLPGSSAAKVSKVDYYADFSLIVTFPSQVHETMTSIIDYIRDQMWEHGFYWDAWSDKKDRIVLSKSISNIPFLNCAPILILVFVAVPLKIEDKSYMFMPDNSLLLYGFEVPFIVCEVAVSQTLKAVMAKKRPYLLGSKNKVRFLIIIYLRSEKPSSTSSGKRSRDSLSLTSNKRGCPTDQTTSGKVYQDLEDSEQIGEASSSPPGSSLSQYESGHVFVYTTTLQPSKNNPSHQVRCIQPVVENLVSMISRLPYYC